jgi:hypothetical protein
MLIPIDEGRNVMLFKRDVHLWHTVKSYSKNNFLWLELEK